MYKLRNIQETESVIYSVNSGTEFLVYITFAYFNKHNSLHDRDETGKQWAMSNEQRRLPPAHQSAAGKCLHPGTGGACVIAAARWEATGRPLGGRRVEFALIVTIKPSSNWPNGANFT